MTRKEKLIKLNNYVHPGFGKEGDYIILSIRHPIYFFRWYFGEDRKINSLSGQDFRAYLYFRLANKIPYE